MRTTGLLIVVIATLTLVTVGAWADNVYTGNWIKVGIDDATATLWANDIGAAGTGVFFDGSDTSNFVGKTDWLTPDGATQFSFWAVKSDQFGTMVNGWDNSQAPTAPGLSSFAWTISNAPTALETATHIDRIWVANLTSGLFKMNVTREFVFDTAAKTFKWTTTLDNPNEAGIGLDLTNVYYSTGFDPGPGLPGTPNTDNSQVAIGSSNKMTASFGFPAFESISLFGHGTPYMSTAYTTNPLTLYNGGVPLGGGSNDDNIALGFQGGTSDTPFTTLAGGDGSILTVTYTFDKGVATPEVGTFALMGLSMLPMAGLALRRRRKSA
jgi:hypothetical protein